MVPGAGIEPARCFHRGILSPLRLPISPPGQGDCIVGSHESAVLYPKDLRGSTKR